MNRILKALGYLMLTLAVVVLMVVVWFGINASKNIDRARPYFEENLAVLVGWEPERLTPMLTPVLQAQLRSQEGRRYLLAASELGALQSFEQLQYLGTDTGVTIDGQDYDLLGYSLLAHFAGGDARLHITLAQSDDTTLVHDVRIRASALPTGTDQ
ncbi:MAG: hypothetical protein R3175_08130 [Marinobacter sp.]|uniref:hypothetical protein n=1 Tax=Marinobacter sp. TaxID=50741 RepID=UPI00299D04F0|nr:hypothetical protein [Marinobacter sp.]MDX1756008.1 hypothetical protein [Marinobacter sp.]